MLNDATNVRRQRGMEIAATTALVRHRDAWLVPSQTMNGKYHVRWAMEGMTCDCPDFELRGQTCKHGYAVEFMLRREAKPDGTVIETRTARVTYSQNWPAYNRAQTTEKGQFCTLLRDLVSTVPTPEPKRGRPPLPLSDMLFAAAFKTYSTVSGRRFMTDLSSAQALGFIDKTPHYNSIFNVLDREDVTPILTELITRAALPLKALESDFAVDSTGFGLQSFYRHYSAKYGHEQNYRDFLKLHAIVGAKTNVIAACEVTDRSVHDSPMMRGLVETVGQHFNVSLVSADKAYSALHNLQAIEQIGAKPYIPFKSNTRERKDSALWNKLFHFFQFSRDEFLAKYHTRSNVESTFSALKRKFGSILRSKTNVARRNELLMMVLCHNIVCVIHQIEESGVTAMFPALCPTIAELPKKAFHEGLF